MRGAGVPVSTMTGYGVDDRR